MRLFTENKVVRTEDLAVGAGADGVHGARLEVDENSTWNVFATRCLVVVDIDALELQIRITVVATRRVNAVLIRDHLPEL